MAHDGVSKSFQTEWIKKYILISVIGSSCPFQSRPHPSLCNRSSISTTAEALLTLTLWNYIKDSQELFLNFRNILETTPSQLQFHSQKHGEITWGQIRHVKRVGENSHVISRKKNSPACQQATEAQTSQRSITCPSLPLEFADMFHTRGPFCQQSPK